MENKNKKIVLILVGITIAGFVLRLIFCFWGFPYQFHPDEHTIVDSAIDMLSRHSWEAFVYNRPDHFEIKCNAILFSVFSWLKYGMPAYEAFEAHRAAFYFIARVFTTIFGTALIPLMYMTVGKILKSDKIHVQRAQILAAAMTAFSPIFIEHSAYATPDMVLTFFVLLVGYISANYLETSERKYIYWIAGITGICITIKYPAAVMCIYIAFIVIYKCIRDKKGFSEILRMGLSSIGIVLLTMFMLAPNLFTDFNSVVTTFITEARPNHLGQDGLSFFGNMIFYFSTIFESFGCFSVVLFSIGGIYLFKNRKNTYFPLLLSGIFWVCLSFLSLHWVRWGIPMFLSFIIIVAIGSIWLYELAGKAKKSVFVCRGICVGIIALLLINTVISGVKVVKWSTVEDTRITSLAFCEENDITKQNSVYEGYTPLSMDAWPGANFIGFRLDDGKIKVSEKYAAKQYFVLSDSFMQRYFNEADAYPEEAAIYKAIVENYPMIYSIDAEKYESSPFEVESVKYGLEYIFNENSRTGRSIYIYDLQPEYYTLQLYNQEDRYVGFETEDPWCKSTLMDNPYIWAIYKDKEEISLTSKISDLLLCVEGESFTSGALIKGGYVTDKNTHRWRIQEEDGYSYLLSQNDMALTYEDGNLILRPFTGDEQQKWVLEKTDI